MTETRPNFKYYDIFASLSVAVLLISNTVAVKLFPIGPFIVGAGIFVFPITYIVSDILTEVYGYQRARRVTWMMIAMELLMVFFYQIAIWLPPLPDWPHQEALKAILGSVPRIVIASIIAILVGDLINCYVLSRMKIWTKGKHLWTRTIGSTFLGQAVDSFLFFGISFFGTMPLSSLFNTIISAWLIKTAYEAVLTPLTYFVIAKLKRAEGVDHFDIGVDYTPFSLKVDS